MVNIPTVVPLEVYLVFNFYELLERYIRSKNSIQKVWTHLSMPTEMNALKEVVVVRREAPAATHFHFDHHLLSIQCAVNIPRANPLCAHLIRPHHRYVFLHQIPGNTLSPSLRATPRVMPLASMPQHPSVLRVGICRLIK